MRPLLVFKEVEMPNNVKEFIVLLILPGTTPSSDLNLKDLFSEYEIADDCFYPRISCHRHFSFAELHLITRTFITSWTTEIIWKIVSKSPKYFSPPLICDHLRTIGDISENINSLPGENKKQDYVQRFDNFIWLVWTVKV